MTDEVLIRTEGRVGRVTLNRPLALHALTLPMVEAISAALLSWRDDPAVTFVLLDHAGPRGFCAGADIRLIAQSGAADGAYARAFFLAEYRLNHLLHLYEKPIMAIMDGVTMGGGAGLALPTRYRVATERTLFAMPETAIGLFPDVGSTWRLPRLPAHMGQWLGLTGVRIRPADCELLGLATDVVASAQLDELKAAVIEDPDAAETLLTRFEADPGRPPVADHRDLIARVFRLETVEAILAALQADASPWALEQHALLSARSPQSLKIALRQMRLGAECADLAAAMRIEYRIACRVAGGHDFLEGVRAVVIDKDHAPRWSPATLADVTESLLDKIFAPLPSREEWSPLP